MFSSCAYVLYLGFLNACAILFFYQHANLRYTASCLLHTVSVWHCREGAIIDEKAWQWVEWHWQCRFTLRMIMSVLHIHCYEYDFPVTHLLRLWLRRGWISSFTYFYFGTILVITSAPKVPYYVVVLLLCTVLLLVVGTGSHILLFEQSCKTSIFLNWLMK